MATMEFRSRGKIRIRMPAIRATIGETAAKRTVTTLLRVWAKAGVVARVLIPASKMIPIMRSLNFTVRLLFAKWWIRYSGTALFPFGIATKLNRRLQHNRRPDRFQWDFNRIP